MNEIIQKAKNDFYTTLNNSKYKLLEEYNGTNKKIKVLCNNGHEWSVTPSHFKRGVRCPKCSGKCKESAEERFKDALKKENYILLGEYINSKIKVDLKCPEGHIYNTRANDFMMGHRCKQCYINNNKEIKERKSKSFNDLKKLADKKGWEILGEYINIKTKILMKCPNGHEIERNINHFKKGFGCSICSGLNSEYAKNKLFELVKLEGYEIVGEYKNNGTKIKLKCPNNHVYSIKPNYFNNGNRCPKCHCQSYGEEKAIKLLEKNNIDFITQKTFKDLKGLGNGNLRFDIYIPSINSVIEINGEQHYNKDHYNSNNVIEHDKIKKDYCKKNNIKYIEIEYNSSKLGKRKALKKIEEDILNIIKSI